MKIPRGLWLPITLYAVALLCGFGYGFMILIAD